MKATGQKAVDLMMESLSNCGSHPLAFQPALIASVEVAFYRDNGGEDEQGTEEYAAALVVLKYGGFGVVTNSSDYTGHGCQCDGQATVWDRRDYALRLGLTEEEALELGLGDERKAIVARAENPS